VGQGHWKTNNNIMAKSQYHGQITMSRPNYIFMVKLQYHGQITMSMPTNNVKAN